MEVVAFYLQGFVYQLLYEYLHISLQELSVVALIPLIGFVLIFLSAIWITIVMREKDTKK